MAVVGKAVSLLVDKLHDTVMEDISLLSGVREQIEWVETELRRMECFLKDADGQEEENECAKNWRQELREITYNGEDAIDIFLLRIDYVRRAEGCWAMLKRGVFILKEVAACKEVASQVERMKQKLRSISESRATYGIQFQRRGSGGMLQGQRPSSPEPAGESDFVDFGKKVPELVRRLSSSEPNRRSVLSIVGMGGLGKTCLAAQLYKSDEVIKEFGVRAWVSLSERCPLDTIYALIHKQVVREKVDSMESEKRAQEDNMNMWSKLKEDIEGHLKQQRYLVVLDDVWTKKAWDDLKDLFPDSNNGSRVILTTRNEDLAPYADPCEEPHKPEPLNAAQSWELFSRKAFTGKEDPRRSVLGTVGKKIAGKCGGLPLAIVAMAGALAGKEQMVWEHALKSIKWQLGEGEARISGVLQMSYRNLPYDMKPCFLYLGIFPEDEEIPAKRLIRMWAAEGLLQERGDESLEEVGEDYLMALAQRNLVRVVRTSSSTGRIKSCRVNNLLQDLAMSEAKGDRFLQVRRPGKKAALSMSNQARRLAIHENLTEEHMDCAPWNLRSLFIYCTDEKQDLKGPLGQFKLLRVLDLHETEITELPGEIGDLLHLRYLAFGVVSTVVVSLPSTMGKLRDLQTIVCYSFRGIKIPSSVERMTGLRHVHIRAPYGYKYTSPDASKFEGQPKVELLSRLRTLTNIKADEWVQRSLGKLTSLTKLGITVGSVDFHDYIAKLESLESLSVSVPDFVLSESGTIPKLPLKNLLELRKLSLYGKLEELPEPSEFPDNLTKVTLAFSGLDQEAITTLGQLNNLRTLKLMQNAFKGKEMTCPVNTFLRLEYFHLERLPELDKLKFEKETMPELKRLNINLCEKLQSHPEGLEHLNPRLKMEINHYSLESLANEIKKYLHLLE